MPSKIKAALEAIMALEKPHPKCRDAHEAVRIARAALRELEAQPEPGKRKCRFCGDPVEFLDRWSHCKTCIDGMERTNGD